MTTAQLICTPIIASATVTEYHGDNDGYIEIGEGAQLSYTVNNTSIDHVVVSADGTTIKTLSSTDLTNMPYTGTATVTGLATSGNHNFTIEAFGSGNNVLASSKVNYYVSRDYAGWVTAVSDSKTRVLGVAAMTSTTPNGNWIQLTGGKSIMTPDMVVNAGGYVDLTKKLAGYVVTVNGTIPDSFLYNAGTYPFYIANSKNVVGGTLYASSDYADMNLTVAYVDVSKLATTKLDFSTIDTLKQSLKNISITDVEDSLVTVGTVTTDANGEATLPTLSDLSPGIYGLFVYDSSIPHGRGLITATPVVVLPYDSSLSVCNAFDGSNNILPGNLVAVDDNIVGAPAYNYTYVAIAIPESEFKGTVNFSDANTINGINASIDVLGINTIVNLHDIAVQAKNNLTWAQQYVKDMFNGSDAVLAIYTSSTSNELSLKLTDNAPTGNYILTEFVYDALNLSLVSVAQTNFNVGQSVPPILPAADFNTNVTSGYAPLTVQFTDTSSGSPLSYDWNFGDGSANATTKDVQHTFTNVGDYTVTLTVTNLNGSSTTQKVVSVYSQTIDYSNLYFGKYGSWEIYKGTTMLYTLYYYNLGSDNIPNVVIKDPIPSELDYVSSSNDGVYYPANRTVVWDIGTVGSYYSSSTGYGTLSVTVSVASGTAEGTQVNNTAIMTAGQGYSKETSAYTLVRYPVMPANTSVGPINGVLTDPSGNPEPMLYWHDNVTFTYTDGMDVTGVDITIHSVDNEFSDIVDVMAGGPPTWSFSYTFYPKHGYIDVTYKVHHANGTVANIELPIIYIDPAGYVYDVTTGAKIQGAEVYLQKWNDTAANFVNVTPGLGIMSPDINPMITDEFGAFECNATAGLYRIYVQAHGYVPTYTANFTLPPEVTNLQIGLTPTGLTSFTINLKTGWNLVSFPVDNHTMKASDLEASLPGNQAIYGFNATTQKYYGYDEQYSTDSDDFVLGPDVGYFVLSDTDTSFTVDGLAMSGHSVHLVSGWNLVGWSTFNTTKASDLEALLSGDEAIYGFNATTQKYFGYDELYSTDSDDFSLKPGMGYWVMSSEATTLNYV